MPRERPGGGGGACAESIFLISALHSLVVTAALVQSSDMPKGRSAVVDTGAIAVSISSNSRAALARVASPGAIRAPAARMAGMVLRSGRVLAVKSRP